MEPAFACNVSLYLGLVDTINASPCEGSTYDNCPEGMPLQRIRIKATMRGKKRKKKNEMELGKKKNDVKLIIRRL